MAQGKARTRRRLAGLLALIAVVALINTATAADDPVVLEVTPERVPVPQPVRAYPAYDADGKQLADHEWRVNSGIGNCCENYLAATADGRLLNYGGTYLHYSDDAGRTWYRLRPPGVLLAGEGAVVPAPGGDIVGVGWDPYTGDRLQAFKYDASEEAWFYAEVPLHTPFYDRPWIAVIPGPVTIAGQTVEYVSVIRGAWPSKEILFYSLDGLRYLIPASRQADAASNAAVPGPLAPEASAHADYGQSHSEARIVPLGTASAFAGPEFPSLAGPTGCTSATYVTGPDLRWACHEPAGERAVWHVADSDAVLHAVQWSPDGTIIYRSSADGGQTVDSQALPLPSGFEVTSPTDVDLKANAAAGVVAVATYARNTATGTEQHLVFKLRKTEAGDYELHRVLLVGQGDLTFGTNAGTLGTRFDFASIAILPDGRVAVSFNDSAHTNPGVAIEVAADTSSASVGDPGGELAPPNLPTRLAD